MKKNLLILALLIIVAVTIYFKIENQIELKNERPIKPLIIGKDTVIIDGDFKVIKR